MIVACVWLIGGGIIDVKCMKKSKLIVVLLIVCISFQGYSQKRWSLDDCINFAINHNLGQKNSTYASQVSRENYQQAKRNFLPGFNLSSSYGISYGRYVDQNTNDIINMKSSSNSYSTGTSIVLFNGFRIWNTVILNKLIFQASKEDELMSKYDLSFRVMDAFYNVKFKKGLLKVAKEQQELSLLDYKITKAKVKLGLKATSDIYLIESMIGTEKLHVLRAKQQLEEAQLKLIQEMNLEENQIKLQPEIVHLKTSNNSQFNASKLFEKALEFLPEIKKERLNVQAAQKSLSISKSNLYPSISLGASFSTGYFETRKDLLGNTIGYFDQLEDNLSKFVGVSMQIPITNKWSARSNIKKASINVLKTANNLAQKKLEVYKTVQQLLQKNEALLVEKQMNQQNIKSKELVYTISQKKYNKGLIDIYELQQSKNFLAKAKIEQIRIELQLQIQKKTYDFYNGVPVFNNN